MRSILLGTDWWDDCDDAVALRLLARAHLAGRVRLCGVAINGCMEHSVASVDGFLSREGLTEIPPIGIDRAGTDFGSHQSYQKRLATYATRYHGNGEAEDGVRLYRRILSEATEPVEICEIGFLQIVADLLESEPDDLSPLCGVELVRQKVAKLWVMAGRWDMEVGLENNFAKNERARDGAHRFCAKCPSPVTFLGFEVGHTVLTGDNLTPPDHLYDVLCDHGSKGGRLSWDPMLVDLALIGDEAAAGYDTVQGGAFVDRDTGTNRFVPSGRGLHRYVIKKEADTVYQTRINKAIG